MQIETLEYLLALEQHGSTRKAAEQLNTSYQNVSRVLLQAEEEWGVTLFYRNPKGLSPTEEGELAISNAKVILKLYNDMLEQFHYRADEVNSTRNERISGNLELVSSMVANNGFANDLLVEFSAQYPRIQVHLMEEDAYLSENKVAARLSFVPRLQENMNEAGETIMPLLEDKVVLLARKDSLFAKQRSISLKRVMKLPLVVIAKNNWEKTIFGHILAKNRLHPENPVFLSSVIGFQKYIATGQYVGLSTEIISRKLMSDKKQMFAIIPMREKNINFYYCLVIRDGNKLSRTEQCFVNFVKESFHLA